MVTINSLQKIPFDEIYEAFNEAFKDYEMQLNRTEFETMLQRRGFIPELSFTAYENDKIISFTFNGIGTFKGVKTAYDTGTGTIEKFRGQGLATKIFQHSIPFLKEAGIVQYLLEVLQHNSKAVSVYKKQGFHVSREFNYFVEKMVKVNIHSRTKIHEIEIKRIDLAMAESKSQFFDFNPSWQNSFQSIYRKPEDFISIGAFKKDELVGYCIFEPNSGDITQIAVGKNFRRIGIGTSLLKEMVKLNRHHSIKIINTEINCESLNSFLQNHSIAFQGNQFEMIKLL